jgi:uncharacterized damage-inducible protein DinB
MAIAEALLSEFDNEMANTRKTLERVPEGKGDFKPHPKSMTLARLAGHLAELPWWGVQTFTKDSVDIAGPDAGTGYSMTTRAALLEKFDGHVAATRRTLASASDADFTKPWSLKKGGQTILTLPRVAVMRSFVMNHMIHHRAQLGVYLRMNDVPVPSIYGPSADEGSL